MDGALPKMEGDSCLLDCVCQILAQPLQQSQLILMFMNSLLSSPAPRNLSSLSSVRSYHHASWKSMGGEVLTVRWEEGVSDFFSF